MNDRRARPARIDGRAALLIALALWAAAALLRFGLAPLAARLPAGYTRETAYAATARSRTAVDGAWEELILVARRADQAILEAGTTALVQGNLYWYTADGRVLFENIGLYGVDRRSRENVTGYGNVDRQGQFLFPPHLKPTAFTLWDPMFLGPRAATFDRVEAVEGLAAYVFEFTVAALDETDGYGVLLPDVPERYHAHTDGGGTLWIEPVSGVLVDYAEHGVSYFADPITGARVADFYQWEDRYTADTRRAQLQLAASMRRKLLLLEVWLPAVMIGFGLICGGLGVWRLRTAGSWNSGAGQAT